MKPSKREAQTLAFIASHIKEHGRAPFQYEIAAHLGTTSRGFVCRMISNMARKGLIRCVAYMPAGIELVDRSAA